MYRFVERTYNLNVRFGHLTDRLTLSHPIVMGTSQKPNKACEKTFSIPLFDAYYLFLVVRLNEERRRSRVVIEPVRLFTIF